MIIQKAKYKKVRKWVEQEVSPEKHGCDMCKKSIEDYPQHDNCLEVRVWPDKSADHETKEHHFCSWECLFRFIPKIKCNYFASLPYLHFDEKGKRSAQEFIDLIKKLKLK